MTVKLTIDCMGGDHGPSVTVPAAVNFVRSHPDAELLLSLPLVPKHEVCPEVHESLVSGVAGAEGEGDEAAPDEAGEGGEPERPNPFAALESLKRGEPGDKKH